MSNNEAKFLLNAYRPNGRDGADPAFAAALGQAKADPALGAWFAREQAHAAAVSAKLREIAPPPGLRDAILAGVRATEHRTTRANRWSMPQWLALAACLVAIASLAILLLPKNAASAERLVAFALDDIVHGKHGGHGEPQTVLQAVLGNATTRLASGLPIDFAKLEKTGCRTLQVAGHDVLEVCFIRNGAEFHCYVARARDFRGAKDDEGNPMLVQQGSRAAATWARNGYRFVIASDAGLDAVKRLL